MRRPTVPLIMFIGFIALFMGSIAINYKAIGETTKDIDFSKYNKAAVESNEDKAMGIDYEDADPEELRNVSELECVEEKYPVLPEIPLEGAIQIEIQKLCEKYTVSYPLILAMIEHETHFIEEYKGEHVGLMQVSTKWCADIADELDVSMLDTLGSVEVGICYIAQLLEKYQGEPALALMEYNMGGKALELYRKGYVSEYAKNILQQAEKWKRMAYGK